MSSRLDLAIAFFVWSGGFLAVGRLGSWLPLALAATLAAARLLWRDPLTRPLLRPSAALLGLGLVAGLSMAAATWGLWVWAVQSVPELRPEVVQLYGILRAEKLSRPALAALLSVVASSEEIVWRGRILEKCARAAERLTRPRQLLPVVGHAAFYGAAHLASGSWTLALVAFACGTVWGLLRVMQRSLWPAIVTHVLWDLLVLIAWPLV